MHVKSYESVLMDIPEYRFLKYLLLYVPPVLIAVGTFGNVLSFVVLRRQPMAKVSSFMYLATLAIADTFVLYVGLLRVWLDELIGVDIPDTSQWLCKSSVLVGYMVSDLSVWLIIAVTVERFIVVCHPLRASRMCNTKRARFVIGFLTLTLISINLHFIWTVDVVEQPMDGRNVANCEAAAMYTHLVDEVWPWVDAFIYSLFPSIIIIVLNILIIVEVAKARSSRQGMQNMTTHHYKQQMRRSAGGLNSESRRRCGPGESTKITIMLLSVSFTFLLTTLPMNASLIVTAFWDPSAHSHRDMSQFRLGKIICELLMYVNHSINFFLYCATGKRFRQQIIQLLWCSKESDGSWTSVHTEPIQMSSIKSGSFITKRHILVATNSEELSGNDTEMAPLRTKV